MIVAAAATGLVLLTGCGDDVKDAVDQASGAASSAKAAADEAADKARALNELGKIDKDFIKSPDQALGAARDTCNFMDRHSSTAKQLDEVRDKFDPLGASDLEAGQARIILRLLKNEVCPLLD